MLLSAVFPEQMVVSGRRLSALFMTLIHSFNVAVIVVVVVAA